MYTAKGPPLGAGPVSEQATPVIHPVMENGLSWTGRHSFPLGSATGQFLET
jgi:hypothetical protein